MVRDGIQKLWEGDKNNVRGNASHRSGKHDTASQQNNARSLPCTENYIPAKEGIFWQMSTWNMYKQLLYFLLLTFCYQYQLNLL